MPEPVARRVLAKPPLFMTPSTATPPGSAPADFRSVAGPHRKGEYASGPLGRESHHLLGLETFRNERVMNKGG